MPLKEVKITDEEVAKLIRYHRSVPGYPKRYHRNINEMWVAIKEYLVKENAYNGTEYKIVDRDGDIFIQIKYGKGTLI